jgi:hypothetical protein
MKKLAIIGVIVGSLLSSTSCTDESTFPLPLNDLQGSGSLSGAYMRILEFFSTNINYFEIENSEFGFRFETVDPVQGTLFERANMYVRYVNLTNNPNIPPNQGRILIDVISNGNIIETSRAGNPIREWSTSITSVLSALNLTFGDLNQGDGIEFEWEMHLTDGRIVTRNTVSRAVREEPFYNSPFFRRLPINCFLDEQFAVGNYQLEQISVSPTFDVDMNGSRFINQVVTLEPNTSGAANRRFSVSYNGVSNINFNININCGRIEVPMTSSTLDCGDDDLFIMWNSADLSLPVIIEDDEITIRFWDDFNEVCERRSIVELKLTKI